MSDASDSSQLATTEEMERAAAHLAQTAWLASEYWKQLMDAHVPPDLAHDLVTAWHAVAIADQDPPVDDDG